MQSIVSHIRVIHAFFVLYCQNIVVFNDGISRGKSWHCCVFIVGSLGQFHIYVRLYTLYMFDLVLSICYTIVRNL